MKNHYAITISEYTGSRHFFVKKTVKKNLIRASVALLAIVATSFFTNYLQFNSVASLVDEKKDLYSELIRFDSQNSNLNQLISNQRKQITSISDELVEIEKASGVETADLDLALNERIRLIGSFYNTKEEEYSEIGSRVEIIEGLIGMGDEGFNQEQIDLATRVELATLSASQERILHDSIPNGYPTESTVITSKFGMRKNPVTKVKSIHKGVDLRAKTGDKVFATADGFISEADFSDLSGNRILALHNYGFESRYSHLKEMLVSPGDIVHKGDLIGYSGNTGRSAAPHLHYEIRYLGKSIDPYQFLEWEFGTHEIFTQVRGIKWPSLISLINKQITHQTLQLSQLDLTSPVE